ncbi:MAG: phage major capsid protein [Holosporales bacterium]|jgi:HK97 family phage major capsid protein|nr:phage major capsid protein [Holosporales bacterium]
MKSNVSEALDGLYSAFHEFKSSNSDRLNELEEKIAVKDQAGGQMTDKTKKLDAVINKAEAKLREISMKQSDREEIVMKQQTDNNQEHKQAIANYLRKGDDVCIREVCTKAALSSATDNIGGFIMPAEIVHRMNKALLTTSSMRSIARVTTISTSALEVLIEKQLPNTGWANETDARDQTDAAELEKISIDVHAIYARPKASQQLLDDSKIDIEEWLMTTIAEKIAVIENQAFVNGDGNNKPKGFLTYDGVDKESWEWGKIEVVKSGANGTFGDDPAGLIIDVLGSLKSQYLQGAVWVMPRSTLSEVRKIRDRDSGRYLWTPNLEQASPSTLLGYPVVIMDDMPALAGGTASKSMAFGNFKSGYQIVDRQELQIIRDPFSAKPFVEFYVTKRVGGAVVDFDAIKVVNFSE